MNQTFPPVMFTPHGPDNQAIRELRDAAVGLVKTSDQANRRMARLTWALVVLTVVILLLTAVMAWPVVQGLISN